MQCCFSLLLKYEIGDWLCLLFNPELGTKRRSNQITLLYDCKHGLQLPATALYKSSCLIVLALWYVKNSKTILICQAALTKVIYTLLLAFLYLSNPHWQRVETQVIRTVFSTRIPNSQSPLITDNALKCSETHSPVYQSIQLIYQRNI